MAQPEVNDPKGLDALRTAKAAVKFAENPQKAVVRAIVRSALEKNGGLSPLKIFSMLNDHYGHEWWDWEPETIWSTLAAQHGLAITPELRNIVGALQTTLNTNFAFELWHVFEKTGLAFNLHHVDPDVVQPLEPNEASLTIFILKMLRPKLDFEPDVLGYVAALCHEAGLVYAPPELFGPVGAQGWLEKIAPDHSGVGHQTAMAWPRKPSESDPPALRIQLARLHEIKDYVKARL